MYRPQYTRASYRIAERIHKQTEPRLILPGISRSDPHDISFKTRSPDAQLKAHKARISTLIASQIIREEDTIRRYDELMAEMDKSPLGYTQGRELVAHIREQEIGHAALLKRLR